MSKELLSALLQLVISLTGAGLLVQLLLLRQNRRKIAGDASASEANAASTLSGAAMKMVENSQAKEREAEARAETLQRQLSQRQREYEQRRDRDAVELENRGWKIHRLEVRIAILEGALRQMGVAVPPPPEEHSWPPPPQPPPQIPSGGPEPA